jgi:dihydrodipicolinate synthase/N-acetylneuraminate lyase
MDMHPFRTALNGLIATPITPFRSDYAIDVQAIAENVEFLLERGVRLFVTCGSIGEFASLTLDERKTVLGETIKAIRQQGLVLTNISGTDQESILELAQHAADVGAAGVMILPPYYHRLSPDEVLDFFRWLDSRIDLPFVLYNNPGTTNMNVSMDVLDALSHLRRFAGLKEANPDVVRFHRIFRRFGARFPVIAATETPVAFFLLSGSPAVMTASIDHAPEFMKNLLEAALAGNVRQTWDLYDHLLAVRELAEPFLQQGYPAYIPFTKAALEARGLRAGPPRPPLRPLDPSTRTGLEKALKSHLFPQQVLSQESSRRRRSRA